MSKEVQDALQKLGKLKLTPNGNITEDAAKGSLDAESKLIQQEINLRDEKARHRKVWGRVLLALVCVGFVASYVIIILIGCKLLQYDSNQFAVPSVVAAGLIGTYGLAKIAVKYFFND